MMKARGMIESSEAVTKLNVAPKLPLSSNSKPASEQSLVQTARPTYAAAFQCIGASCEDTCCGDWDIPVDRSTYRRYQQFPFEKLGSLVSQFVLINAPNQPDGLHAQIYRRASGSCPFFGSDRLCGIQKEYGPQLLPATCSIYPRSMSLVAGELEGSLSLSCPEAARNVLLAPHFMQIEGDLFSGDFRTDNIFHLASDRSGFARKPEEHFLAVRRLLIDIVRDRSRPMWHRLLLMGSLCKRMDDSSIEERGEVLPVILRDYREIIENHVFQTELENMPSRPRLKLEVVFELSDARVRDGSQNRFRNTFWTFVEGIGSSDGSLPGDDIERFLRAEKTYHAPLFERFPFILENYLVNYIFQNLFPYGRTGSPQFTPRSIFDEYILMTTQFAWMNALLVGIAGHYKGAFAEEHVVQAVQSFTRTVEHYPDALESINESMRSRAMDTLQGMAIMLKS
jgi:lysine-N-methylase